jgi:predicted NBD/HSP70 family sugar kinase
MNPLLNGGTPRQWDVLRILRGEPGLTRGDIGRILGLSISQLSRVTADLIAAGLIDVDPQLLGGLGRPPETLRLAGSGPWVIGMEVGGGRQRGVLANLRGEPVARANEPRPSLGSEQEALDAFADFVDRLVASAGVAPGQVIGLGLALYAAVDPVEGMVLEWSEEPSCRGWWRGVALRDALAERTGIAAVAIDDTVRMRAAAERLAPGWVSYADADYLYVLADTGIGAAVVIGGRSHLGRLRLAGDIGHVVVDPSGPWCACGGRGCLETLASAHAIEREAGQPLDRVIAAAGRGDRGMIEVLQQAGERIADALAPAATMLCPDVVVLSGSVGVTPLVTDAIRERLLARVPVRLAGTLRVIGSELGDDAGALGAVAAILDLLFAGPAASIELTGLGGRR